MVTVTSLVTLTNTSQVHCSARFRPTVEAESRLPVCRLSGVVTHTSHGKTYLFRSQKQRRQTLDHFGETAGVSFSPCAETLFVGVADLTYGSVLEFERKGLGGGGGGGGGAVSGEW